VRGGVTVCGEVLCRWGDCSDEGFGRPGWGFDGRARGAAACARNRTLVACGRSIGDGGELELELINGSVRRKKKGTGRAEGAW